MKSILTKFTCSIVVGVLVLAGAFLISSGSAYAENEQNDETSETMTIGTSISITPVSRVFQLSPDSEYEDILKVTNDGATPISFEVYAAPYSYVYSEENDSYSLGFSNENNYTQITRWISILDTTGTYSDRAVFKAEPNETVTVMYRIKTPGSLPAGGQYAVLFAHTLSSASGGSGIKTEASPGMVIYGRAEGETILSPEIVSTSISRTITKDVATDGASSSNGKSTTFDHINATAKIKNNGNVDFNARGVLRVEGMFGGVYYETPENKAVISIIPDAELAISDEWEDTPSFGLYKAIWTVTAGEETKTEEMIIFIMPTSVIIFSIILLTIIIVWIIIGIRKRKERRSRLSI